MEYFKNWKHIREVENGNLYTAEYDMETYIEDTVNYLSKHAIVDDILEKEIEITTKYIVAKQEYEILKRLKQLKEGK